MSIVSFNFFVFIVIVFALYFCVPIRFRWCVLLLANIAFWLICSTWQLLCIALIPIGITYCMAIIIDSLNATGGKTAAINACRVIAILVDVAVLIAFKEVNFFIGIGNAITGIFGVKQLEFITGIIAPLGISYYTLTLISYLLDSSWGLFEVQKNPLKFLTYILYFPTLTSGPIMRYKDMSGELFEAKRFEYKNLCFGAQRILWGLFKKLIIADRLAPFVSALKADEYSGLYVFIGIICYTIQLYMDFSGCMDIVIGASEILGIKLPENFNAPLFATNLSEYWRRWHITLGDWVRDYVMNPILKSKGMQRLGKKTKKGLGKKWGKKIPVWIAMLVTWFTVGFWHGGALTFIFGSGLFFFIMIAGGQLLEPVWKWLIKLLHINTESIIWKMWQRIRTFLLFSVSISFSWAASMTDGFNMLKRGFETFNPGILIDGSLTELGIDGANWIVVFIALIIVLIVSNLRKKGSVREQIASCNIAVRWIIFLVLFFVVIIFGVYGMGYDSSAFIYGAF